MAPLIIFGSATLLLIIFFKPKWGTHIVWFILFCYPHGWWANNMLLPLNIGFDDLFCLVLFIVVLIRRNILERLPIRFGYSFWVITAFTIIGIVAIWNGSTYVPSYFQILYIKDIMKFGVYWALFYAFIHCIDNVSDLEKQIKWFTTALAVGAILVIMHYFHPRLMEPWTRVEYIERSHEFRGRAYGAFGNPNSAACLLAAGLCLIITMMRFERTFVSKIIAVGYIFVCLIAVAVTKSRAGLMALAGTFLLMAFFSRNRKTAWIVIIAGVVVGMLFSEIRREFLGRIEDIYSTETKAYGLNIENRFLTWRTYFETATPRIYLLGQGQRAGSVRNPSEPHSAYVSLITVYGIGGSIWAITSLIGFLRRSSSLIRSRDPLISTLASGLVWALISWGIYATAADTVSSQYSRYFLFYLVVLLERASYIFKHSEEQLPYREYPAEFLYEESDNFSETTVSM